MEQILNITFPLITDEGQKNILNKKLRVAANIYNDMLDHEMKKYRHMTLSKEWQKANKVLEKFFSTPEGEAYKANKKGKKLPDDVKAVYEYRNQMYIDYGFTKFSFRGDVKHFTERFQSVIPSNMAICTIADRMWTSFDKMLFGFGKTVHFTKVSEFNSFVTNGKSGMRLLKDEKGYYLFFSNRKAHAKEYKIRLKSPETDYDEVVLHEVEKGNLRLIRVLRKKEKGKDHFYCQLTVNMEPFEKLDTDGKPKHQYGTGKVGLNIWRNHVAAVSENAVKYFDLAPNREQHLAKVKAMTRELEEIRRKNNPDNYNENGTVKNGIVVNGKRQRLRWNNTYQYKQLRKRLAEEHRIYAENLKLYQRHLVYELLEMGDEFVLYDTSSYITKKLEYDEENRLSNAEYKKKKDRRKSIEHNAPSQFLSYLDTKLALLDLPVIHRIKVPEHLYWYRHDKCNSDKSYLPEQEVMIQGVCINQTIYRAFLILHYNINGKFYDNMSEAFDKFVLNL